MNAVFYSQVGSNIQTELDKRNMTQQSLADALRVSKQVMSKIVNGTKAINVDELTQIAHVLGISVDALLTVPDRNAPQHNFSFMGRIQNAATKDKIEMLKTVIDEILFLEAMNHE